MTNPTQYALVPKVPTHEMKIAGREHWVKQEDRQRESGIAEYRTDMLDEIYRAMLAAAPHAGEVGREQFEQLAELEHKQWCTWAAYMLQNMTPENILRWERQIKTDYADLTEKEKGADRVFALRQLAAIGLEVEGEG